MERKNEPELNEPSRQKLPKVSRLYIRRVGLGSEKSEESEERKAEEGEEKTTGGKGKKIVAAEKGAKGCVTTVYDSISKKFTLSTRSSPRRQELRGRYRDAFRAVFVAFRFPPRKSVLPRENEDLKFARSPRRNRVAVTTRVGRAFVREAEAFG